jgi:hypothetical protein
MAYLKSYKKKCTQYLCGKNATEEVMNHYNASCGVYCPTHALVELKRMNDAENKTSVSSP